MPSGPSTKKAHRQRHLQTKLGNALSQFGKGGRAWGTERRERNGKERRISSLCKIARPGFKIGESSPLGNVHVLFPIGTSGCDGQGRGGAD